MKLLIQLRNLALGGVAAVAMSAAFLVVTVASPATAAIIFEDDFNRPNSNTVGNGWVEREDESNDVAIILNSALQLRDFLPGLDAAASQLGGFSTVGLTNITLSYDWAASNNTESNDSLFAQWKLSGDAVWNTLVDHALGGSGFVSASFGLGAGALNVTDLQIRFAIDVSTYSEAAFIDNVRLTGYSSSTQVPEPGTLALFGFGLAGLGFLVRRRRRDV